MVCVELLGDFVERLGIELAGHDRDIGCARERKKVLVQGRAVSASLPAGRNRDPVDIKKAIVAFGKPAIVGLS
jgi:hypothetical protein